MTLLVIVGGAGGPADRYGMQMQYPLQVRAELKRFFTEPKHRSAELWAASKLRCPTLTKAVEAQTGPHPPGPYP